MDIDELIEWLQSLPKTSTVHIDDGGMNLMEVTVEDEVGASIEVGGWTPPWERDDDES